MADFVFMDIPREIQDAVQPCLLKWQFIIPGWCREILVIWKDDDFEGAMSITVNMEYRKATLEVCPNFITCPERRDQAVIHEFVHILLEPLRNSFTDVRNALVKECPELKDWVQESHRYAEESVTCDMAYLIQNLSQQEQY